MSLALQIQSAWFHVIVFAGMILRLQQLPSDLLGQVYQWLPLREGYLQLAQCCHCCHNIATKTCAAVWLTESDSFYLAELGEDRTRLFHSTPSSILDRKQVRFHALDTWFPPKIELETNNNNNSKSGKYHNRPYVARIILSEFCPIHLRHTIQWIAAHHTRLGGFAHGSELNITNPSLENAIETRFSTDDSRAEHDLAYLDLIGALRTWSTLFPHVKISFRWYRYPSSDLFWTEKPLAYSPLESDLPQELVHLSIAFPRADDTVISLRNNDCSSSLLVGSKSLTRYHHRPAPSSSAPPLLALARLTSLEICTPVCTEWVECTSIMANLARRATCLRQLTLVVFSDISVLLFGIQWPSWPTSLKQLSIRFRHPASYRDSTFQNTLSARRRQLEHPVMGLRIDRTTAFFGIERLIVDTRYAMSADTLIQCSTVTPRLLHLECALATKEEETIVQTLDAIKRCFPQLQSLDITNMLWPTSHKALDFFSSLHSLTRLGLCSNDWSSTKKACAALFQLHSSAPTHLFPESLTDLSLNLVMYSAELEVLLAPCASRLRKLRLDKTAMSLLWYEISDQEIESMSVFLMSLSRIESLGLVESLSLPWQRVLDSLPVSIQTLDLSVSSLDMWNPSTIEHLRHRTARLSRIAVEAQVAPSGLILDRLRVLEDTALRPICVVVSVRNEIT